MIDNRYLLVFNTKELKNHSTMKLELTFPPEKKYREEITCTVEYTEDIGNSSSIGPCEKCGTQKAYAKNFLSSLKITMPFYIDTDEAKKKLEDRIIVNIGRIYQNRFVCEKPTCNVSFNNETLIKIARKKHKVISTI